MKQELHYFFVVLAAGFFAVMTCVTFCLIMEYQFYKTQVHELADLKKYYEESMNALRLQKEEASKLASEKTALEAKNKSFIVVDRNPQHLQQEAIKFAKKHNIEKPVRQIYERESSSRPHTSTTYRSHRVRTVTRVRVKKNKKLQLQKARERVAQVLGEINWPWPIKVDFRISSFFGPRKRPDGSSGYHTGIDLAAPKGTKVHSVANGIVLEACSNTKGYGNTVVIRHDRRLKTRYAHLDTITVRVGDKVAMGSKIGTVGNTGHVLKNNGRNGIHLHFEVYVGKKRMNPLYFLKER